MGSYNFKESLLPRFPSSPSDKYQNGTNQPVLQKKRFLAAGAPSAKIGLKTAYRVTTPCYWQMAITACY